jgi:hypothetical protein
LARFAVGLRVCAAAMPSPPLPRSVVEKPAGRTHGPHSYRGSRCCRGVGRLNVPDPLPAVDGLLAATAKVHGLTLATRNVRDCRAHRRRHGQSIQLGRPRCGPDNPSSSGRMRAARLYLRPATPHVRRESPSDVHEEEDDESQRLTLALGGGIF